MSEGSQVTKPDKVSYMTQQIHRKNDCNDLLGAVGIELLELLIDTLPYEKTGFQQSKCVLTEVFCPLLNFVDQPQTLFESLLQYLYMEFSFLML